MISLKRYFDSLGNADFAGAPNECSPQQAGAMLLSGYRSALAEFAGSGAEACPALAASLTQPLESLGEQLNEEITLDQLSAIEPALREHLRDWGHRAAEYSRESAVQARELMLLMANTAESVGERDRRCAYRLNDVTANLEVISTLNDLHLMRESVIRSTARLKQSIAAMMEESHAVVESLRREVARYKTRAQEAEQLASIDALTGLFSRHYVEEQIRARIEMDMPTSIVILDIDGFKTVNDTNGHMIGDALLCQFAANLSSICRKTDVLGRWGGDEFIILLDHGGAPARAQVERLSTWICRDYTIPGKNGAMSFRVTASIGMAEHTAGESVSDLFDRADANMYQFKTVQRYRAMPATARQA